jgi:hypothetical protein
VWEDGEDRKDRKDAFLSSPHLPHPLNYCLM